MLEDDQQRVEQEVGDEFRCVVSDQFREQHCVQQSETQRNNQKQQKQNL